MSIRGGFDRLTKEIDALTYNSRSVLNALIRSTVASGSSQGYTVTRAGEELTLTRVDVYRLYTFYQAWAANGFATETGETNSSGRRLLTFDEIRIEQDKTCVTFDDGTQSCNATTDALVIHSQILFLNSNTLASQPVSNIEGQSIDNSAVTSYWLDFLKEFNDPKLLTNSSPIPINLRTPVFDENMGTTKYNNHPTYLFPYQYFGLQLLGYPGDDTDHFGGGNSWTWQLDQYVNFITPAFSSGGVNSASVYKTASERNYVLNPQTGKPFESNYSTVWGYDTHARALYSTAGGVSSMVPREANSGVAIGYRNLASGIQSSSIGGSTNAAVGQSSGVYSGEFNNAVGYGSFAAGINNITGGSKWAFTLPQSDSDTDCVVDTATCDTKFSTTGSQFGSNQIAVSGNIVSSISGNDGVSLYAYTTFVPSANESQNAYYSINGDTFITLNTRVTSIYYDNDQTSLNFGKTIITLNDDLPNPARIDGGSISVTSKQFTVFSGPSGDDIVRLSLGRGSSVFGEGNIASGVNQLVVGQFNRDVTVDNSQISGAITRNFNLSRFIVGSGSSISNRQNTLEVYDSRLIVYANGESLSDIPVNISDYQFSGFRGFNVQNERINMIFDSHRIELNESGFRLQKYVGSAGTISIETASASSGSEDQLRIENWQKSIRIQTGEATSFPTGSSSVIGDLDIASVSARNNIISALNDVKIEAENNASTICIKDLSFVWGGLLGLQGDTFTALPATDNSYSHLFTGSNLDFNNSDFTRSGFYYLNGQGIDNRPTGAAVSGSMYHLLSIAADTDTGTQGNPTMQLAWGGKEPSADDTIESVGRPAIRSKDIDGDWLEWRNLAYLNDVSGWNNDGNQYVERVSMQDNSGNESFSTDTGWNVTVLVNYIVMADTVFFNIHILDMLDGWQDNGIENKMVIEFTSNAPWNNFLYNVNGSRFFDTFNIPNLNPPTMSPFDGSGSRYAAQFKNGVSEIEILGYDGRGIQGEWDENPTVINDVKVPQGLTFHMRTAHT